MGWLRRSRGISLLVPTQNAEATVELCIRSFADFPDEIIVVDNGSTDETKDIVRELEREYDQVTFYDAPHLKDLYENRQYAFERSRFDWVVRIDSDYVAYTNVPHDIGELRTRILDSPGWKGLRPVAFNIQQVNLFNDYRTTGPADESRHYVAKTITTLNARIIHHHPGMKFQRRGRWEGLRFDNLFARTTLDRPYWFHCEFKSPLDLLFRSERTNWRELGDFQAYPTLESFVRSVIEEKYQTDCLEEASARYTDRFITPHLRPYQPDDYFPYPQHLEAAMKDESL